MFNPNLEYRPLPMHAYQHQRYCKQLYTQQHLPQRVQLLNQFKKELVEYTGRDFLVFVDPVTTTCADDHQAVINFCELADENTSVAFWLAHEWGHLIHQDTLGRPHVPASIKEQQADIFAATFMRKKGYPIEGILNVFRVMPPPDDPMDEHGPTDQRMRNIYHAYMGYPRQYPPQYAQPDPQAGYKLQPLPQPQLYSLKPMHGISGRPQPPQNYTLTAQKEAFKVPC